MNDMLMVAKMEAEQLIVNRTPVDMIQIIQQAVEGHEVMAHSKGIEFRLDLPPESHKISVDQNLFQRLLDNLISNALKYSPPKSMVTLSLEFFQATNTPAPEFQLKVFDQGIGIAAEDRERIFDKYAVAALKQKGGQVGLGLAYCKMVANAHQGRIYIEANEPVGSVFIVEI
jgi:signal transduction histidine kinase